MQKLSLSRHIIRTLPILQNRHLIWEWNFHLSEVTDGTEFLATVSDPATVEGAIFASPFCAAVDDPNVVAFVEAYEAAYSATPDQFAADAYDAIYTIKAAMEQAGSTESEDLIAAMTEITVNGLTGESITFSAEGAPNKEIKYVEIKDGQYQYVEE